MPDSVDWPDPRGPVDRDPADAVSLPDQAATVVLWGLGIETHSSADHRYVDGQLQPSKRQVSLRGLNRNHNHELKNIFKGAAIIAATKPGPFQEFYAALVAKGMRPEMARLTLARKIAAIILIVWKKGVRSTPNI